MDFGMVLAAAVIVATVFVTLCRVAPLRRWLGYATYVDVTFTILMFFAFHGTYSGIVAAAFSGLFMAFTLSCMRNALGYERLAVKRVRWSEGIIQLTWVKYPPKKLWTNNAPSLRTRLKRGLNSLRLHLKRSQA